MRYGVKCLNFVPLREASPRSFFSARSRSEGRPQRGPHDFAISFLASTRPKTAKREDSFRQTKPSVSRRVSQVIEIIEDAESAISRNRCFQWVDPRFVSPFSSTALFPIQKHRIQRASANFNSFNALLPTCELRRTSAPVFERFRIAHNERGRSQIWRSRRAPIQRQAALIEQAGAFSSSGQLYI